MVHPGDESTHWKQITLHFMSDESSDEESGLIVVHRPAWRSKSKCTALVLYRIMGGLVQRSVYAYMHVVRMPAWYVYVSMHSCSL